MTNASTPQRDFNHLHLTIAWFSRLRPWLPFICPPSPTPPKSRPPLGLRLLALSPTSSSCLTLLYPLRSRLSVLYRFSFSRFFFFFRLARHQPSRQASNEARSSLSFPLSFASIPAPSHLHRTMVLLRTPSPAAACLVRSVFRAIPRFLSSPSARHFSWLPAPGCSASRACVLWRRFRTMLLLTGTRGSYRAALVRLAHLPSRSRAS